MQLVQRSAGSLVTVKAAPRVRFFIFNIREEKSWQSG